MTGRNSFPPLIHKTNFTNFNQATGLHYVHVEGSNGANCVNLTHVFKLLQAKVSDVALVRFCYVNNHYNVQEDCTLLVGWGAFTDEKEGMTDRWASTGTLHFPAGYYTLSKLQEIFDDGVISLEMPAITLRIQPDGTLRMYAEADFGMTGSSELTDLFGISLTGLLELHATDLDSAAAYYYHQGTHVMKLNGAKHISIWLTEGQGQKVWHEVKAETADNKGVPTGTGSANTTNTSGMYWMVPTSGDFGDIVLYEPPFWWWIDMRTDTEQTEVNLTIKDEDTIHWDNDYDWYCDLAFKIKPFI